jgi:hypothetical protein
MEKSSPSMTNIFSYSIETNVLCITFLHSINKYYLYSNPEGIGRN